MDRKASREFNGRVARFADTFSRAYAAVVYLRVRHSLDEVFVVLLTAKSKVMPIKTISILRLELNAIVLLTWLIESVQNSLNLQQASVYRWTDSSVALAWLRGHLSKWKTYKALFMKWSTSNVQSFLINVIGQFVQILVLSNCSPINTKIIAQIFFTPVQRVVYLQGLGFLLFEPLHRILNADKFQ